MPHSIASKKRVIKNFATNVVDKLRKDPKKLKQYADTIKKLRESAASPTKVIKTINTCLKQYPEFCNRITGFDSDGGLTVDTNPTKQDHGTYRKFKLFKIKMMCLFMVKSNSCRYYKLKRFNCSI